MIILGTIAITVRTAILQMPSHTAAVSSPLFFSSLNKALSSLLLPWKVETSSLTVYLKKNTAWQVEMVYIITIVFLLINNKSKFKSKTSVSPTTIVWRIQRAQCTAPTLPDVKSKSSVPHGYCLNQCPTRILPEKIRDLGAPLEYWVGKSKINQKFRFAQ